MYKEVAFDPSCLGKFEYYSLLKQQFGFEKGRYVAADRRAWAKEAMAVVKRAGLTDIREKSIKSYLNKVARPRGIDEFLLAPDRPKTGLPRWSDWLDNQLTLRPFDLTISDSVHEGFLNIDLINDGHHDWDVPASISVLREAKEIVGAVVSLLRLSTEITLVDQYFYLAGNNTFRELLVSLLGTSVRSVRVVSAVIPHNPEQVYQREYHALNSQGIGLEWIVAPERYFHDRYLITDVGAIRCGHGFVEDLVKGIHADQLNINLIGIAETQRTLQSLKTLFDEGKVTRIALS
ncbi:hypothetical protein SAMN05444062_101213 [Pseudomonas syringae]|uniref:hypothetical protein n=1 Tax=Pseudomonas syringae TaxID=317 RepID=UPI0008DF541E|nr:hypothetical protein [Pseudomonas syringae]SFG74484.1 hypothetical protein SAMN05444062_101213 [Pseudomonas syringae]